MRIYPRHELHAQRERDIAKVCGIIASVGGERSPVKARTKLIRNTAADARVMRMIPITAEGVAGTVPGTNPLDELMAKETRQARHAVRLAP
jgi:hypothetical protein